jgi:hypothetical protein
MLCYTLYVTALLHHDNEYVSLQLCSSFETLMHAGT